MAFIIGALGVIIIIALCYLILYLLGTLTLLVMGCGLNFDIDNIIVGLFATCAIGFIILFIIIAYNLGL